MRLRIAAALPSAMAAALALGGCARATRDMAEQPRLDAGASSPLFADGLATRGPPPGSEPHALGDLAATSSARQGMQALDARAAALAATALPQPVPREWLLRGQERYGIYCLPCHGQAGDGQGPVVRRGFPAPPGYGLERLRTAPDRHLFDVVTQGHGLMYGYADRLAPEDRWAVVAYVRALQWRLLDGDGQAHPQAGPGAAR